KPFGNGCRGSRLVARDQPNVVATFVPLHRCLSHAGEPRRRPTKGGGAHTARDIANIGKDRGCSRRSARAGPDQGQWIYIRGIDRHGVGHTHDLSDGRVLANHRRMHTLFDALRGLHCDTQELHAIAEFVRRMQIGRCDRRNAFHIDRALIDLGTKCKARQDGEFLRGIMTLNVEPGISLRIAKSLSLFQAFGEGHLVLLHPGKDVIAGAVENAINPLERIAGHAFSQSLDDRNGAAHCGFEIERNVFAFGNRRKLDAMAGEQCFVGSHHRFSGCQRRPARSRAEPTPASPALWAAPPPPPISSTKTSMPGSRASATGSANQVIFLRSTPRSLVRERAQTATTSMMRPQRAANASRWREIWATRAAPTVPNPATPTFSG